METNLSLLFHFLCDSRLLLNAPANDNYANCNYYSDRCTDCIDPGEISLFTFFNFCDEAIAIRIHLFYIIAIWLLVFIPELDGQSTGWRSHMLNGEKD